MGETVTAEAARPHVPSLQVLQTFLTAVSAISDEPERARLTATGLPSLLPCHFSGVALLDESEDSWNLVAQNDGVQLSAAKTKQILNELEPSLRKAFSEATVLVDIGEPETSASRLCPSIEQLGVRRLIAVPLRTLRKRLGALLLGRAESETFTREEEESLLTLAEHFSIGIDNLRLYEAVKRSESRVQQIYHHTPVMLHSINRAGNLVEVNDYWLTVMGYERNEVLGRRSTDFLTKPSRDWALSTAIPQLFRTGAEKELELQFVKKNGEVIDVLLSAIVEYDERGRVERTLTFMVDVTERKRAEEAVRQARDELEIRVKERTAELSAATIRLAELQSQLEQENLYLQEEIKTQHNFDDIIGDSLAIKKALADVETVAGTDANVLITGETGTGKELLARAVHNLSPRKEKPLIKVNCASIPRELFESEFFGHVRGAFTGAIKERLGRFELADGGTLFLDEVCEIPIELQSKLLRVLQEGEYERIGEEKTRTVDVRIIAATNRNFEKEIPAGRFRSDLYFRLSVFPIECPPLVARLEDIPLLTMHFVAQACRRFGVAEIPIPQSQSRRLQSYHWPGNIRELQNVIERAVITARSGTFHCELPSTDADRVSEKPSRPLTMPPSATGILSYAELKQQEHENVLAALKQTNWKVAGPSGAAELLRVTPSTLATRMKVLGIQRPN